jgi:pimeloyl-ACP methyl ester carboxylesterase
MVLLERYTQSDPDCPNGIFELKTLKIGGIDQWILVRGQSRENPILLFLHGGPGDAQISYSKPYNTLLEERFIVVNWDQRGAGLSYSESIPKETMKIEQFVKDTRELITWLLDTYKKEKLFLAGHSWGSILGVLVADQVPELIVAYIGIAQVGNMMENERLAYKFAYEYAKKRNNLKAVKQLEKIGEPPYEKLLDAEIRSKWTQYAHATLYKRPASIFFRTAVSTTEYSFIDIYRFQKGMSFSTLTMWDEVSKVSLLERVPELKIPVCFFLGRHDYTVPFGASEQYFEALSAPHKEIIWFEKSAHSIPFEEPVRFQKLVIDKLLISACPTRTRLPEGFPIL